MEEVDKKYMKRNILLMVVFALCGIVMEAAMARAFVYGLLIESLVHAGVYILFFGLFCAFAKKVVYVRLGEKATLIVTTCYCSAHIIMTLLLVGFQYYIPALAVGIFDLALPFAFLFEKTSLKKSILSVFLAAVVLFSMTIPGYFRHTFTIAARESKVELYISEEKGYFTHAVPTEKLYVYTPVPTTTAEVLFHNSLQAYTCRKYSDQIIYESDVTLDPAYTAKHLDTIEKYFGIEPQRIDSQEQLLDIYADRIKNYILYDDSDRQSTFVAANLCYQVDAVMVGKSMKSIADKYGWEQKFDATGWTEKRFVASEYFDKLDRHLLFMMDTYDENRGSYGRDVFMSQLWDVAMMNNSWIVYNDFSIVDLENHLSKMMRNSVCIGSVGENAENAVVQACARYSTTFIYTRYTANMSVLSGFDLKNATTNTDVLQNGEIKKVAPAVYSDDNTPKHTVCVMLSDADNVRFCTESLMSTSYYNSPKRDENLNYNIGLAGSMVEIAPIFLLEFYDGMYPRTDFCYQLSSIGYTYPSKWTDKKAWEQVTKSLVRVMESSKTRVLEIMDDSAFMTCLDVPSNFGALRKYFDTYTCYDGVDGCLFIDYTALYSGYRGAVCWSNDKPVVSAKYSVWWDEGTPYNSERNTIEYIVKEINAASTDKTKEDAYTFIIVHGWSGLDDNGDLVQLSLKRPNVDSTAIFKKLQDSFDDDVEMVTTTEFISRMRRNVKR